jgi:dephospho-CoA kinase
VSAFRVGLTGPLASGKSSVARRLAAAGFHVVDADRLVADLYLPGAPGSEAVRRLFGPAALAADGGVDKAALAGRVFSDPEALRRLEAEIHPLVRRRFAEISGARSGVVVLEATKLVEGGFAPGFDLIVTVESPVEQLVSRAARRGLSEQEIRARLAAQAPPEMRRAAAHFVVENDGTQSKLRGEVRRLIAEIRRRATAADG